MLTGNDVNANLATASTTLRTKVDSEKSNKGFRELNSEVSQPGSSYPSTDRTVMASYTADDVANVLREFHSLSKATCQGRFNHLTANETPTQ